MARDEGRVRVRVSGSGSRRRRRAWSFVVQGRSSQGLGRGRRTGDGQVPTCSSRSRAVAALRQAAPPPPASTAPLKDDIAWGQKQRRSLTAACCCARHSATSPGNDAPCDTEHVGCSLLLIASATEHTVPPPPWRAVGRQPNPLNMRRAPKSPLRLDPGSAGRASLVHASIDVELE